MAILQETKTEKKGHISYTNEYRILRYLREKKVHFFSSADIAKVIGLTSREAAFHLRNVPGVRIFKSREFARNESGVLWTFEEPGYQ